MAALEEVKDKSGGDQEVADVLQRRKALMSQATEDIAGRKKNPNADVAEAGADSGSDKCSSKSDDSG